MYIYIYIYIYISGFPTGVKNMGGAVQNLMGDGFKSIHGGSMGGLKYCQKIPVKEFT